MEGGAGVVGKVGGWNCVEATRIPGHGALDFEGMVEGSRGVCVLLDFLLLLLLWYFGRL